MEYDSNPRTAPDGKENPVHAASRPSGFVHYDGHFVTPYLAVGSRPYPEDVPDIVEAGIGGVLNVASSAPREAFAYVHHLPPSIHWTLCGFWDGFLGDGGETLAEPLTPTYARLVVIRAAEMLRDHSPILIHCMGGKGRSGNTAAILYAAREGITVDEAVNRMLEIRPVLSPFHHNRFWQNLDACDLVELAASVLADPEISRETICSLIRGD